VSQVPQLIGARAVEAAVQVLRGEPVPRTIEIPAALITAHNLAPAINESLELLPQVLDALVESNGNQQRLRDQMLQAQKMESLGRLAGGIAHDFNNILAVISNTAQLALDDLPAGNGTSEELRTIIGASERAAELVRHLLQFARSQIIAATLLDCNALVRGLQRMIERVLIATITLHVELDARIGLVRANATQIEQVLLNLVMNACDAMPHGGELWISTTHIAAHAAQVGHLALPDSHYVALMVRDNGSGIAPDTLAQLFEPFFSTKSAARGTGLGLTTSYQIAQQHGGTITAESTLGAGATFTVYLPEHVP
jgi:two-component system, cell cycle sensor histidine kinase and response regulator CckA